MMYALRMCLAIKGLSFLVRLLVWHATVLNFTFNKLLSVAQNIRIVNE